MPFTAPTPPPNCTGAATAVRSAAPWQRWAARSPQTASAGYGGRVWPADRRRPATSGSCRPRTGIPTFPAIVAGNGGVGGPNRGSPHGTRGADQPATPPPPYPTPARPRAHPPPPPPYPAHAVHGADPAAQLHRRRHGRAVGGAVAAVGCAIAANGIGWVRRKGVAG